MYPGKGTVVLIRPAQTFYERINHGLYSNREVDRILEQARVEQDVTKRIELYRHAEELIVNDAPWIPLYYPGDRYAIVKPRIKGYRFTPMTIPKLGEIYVEE